MFAVISFFLAGIAVVGQTDEDGNSWLSKKGKKTTQMTEEQFDEEINEINHLTSDYDYVEPEETVKERIVREYNERFAYMIGGYEIE